jgi:uncharacterized protein YecT (DUF1311 family)
MNQSKQRCIPIFIVIAILSMARMAFASPSFDCSKSNAPIEKVICSDTALSGADSDLSEAYLKERQLLNADYSNKLLKDQKDWLAHRISVCRIHQGIEGADEEMHTAAKCLIDLYRDRINHINSLIALKGDWEEKTKIDGEDRSVILKKDHTDLSVLGIRGSHPMTGSETISECKTIIDLPYYRANNYGGLCTAVENGKKYPVKICADDMVGNFKIEPLDKPNLTTQELAQFVFENCTGG